MVLPSVRNKQGFVLFSYIGITIGIVLTFELLLHSPSTDLPSLVQSQQNETNQSSMSGQEISPQLAALAKAAAHQELQQELEGDGLKISLSEKDGEAVAPGYGDHAFAYTLKLYSFMDSIDWDDVVDLSRSIDGHVSSSDDLVVFFLYIPEELLPGNHGSIGENGKAVEDTDDDPESRSRPKVDQAIYDAVADYLYDAVREFECQMKSEKIPLGLIVVVDTGLNHADIYGRHRGHNFLYPMIRLSSLFAEFEVDIAAQEKRKTNGQQSKAQPAEVFEFTVLQKRNGMKPLLCRSLLSLGFNLLVVDSGVYFMKNPFPINGGRNSEGTHEIVLHFLDDTLPDPGLFYLDFDSETIAMLEYWVHLVFSSAATRVNSSQIVLPKSGAIVDSSEEHYLAGALVGSPQLHIGAFGKDVVVFGTCRHLADISSDRIQIVRITCLKGELADAQDSQLMDHLLKYDPNADSCKELMAAEN